MYNPPDYYQLDELLTVEHKIIRSSIRDWVNRSVKPIIEEHAQKHTFPKHLIREMGEIGAFGPFILKNMVVQDWIIFHMA